MARWHLAVDHWFARHHGIASAATLERLGMSTSTIHRLVNEGRLIRVFPGVFRSAQWPESFEQSVTAVCAANDGLAIALTTADRLWGFRGITDRGMYAITTHGRSPTLPGVTVRRSRLLEPVDLVERPDGIRLTSPPRSLFDSADMLGFDTTRSILEQILHEGMCTIGTVVDTVARLHHPNRPGSRTMLAVIESRPNWDRALQSGLEMRVLLEIERQGLPTPTPQCPVQLADGSVIHLDFGWPRWQVGLEVDHPTWHDKEADRQWDARRDRMATVVGWSVTRIPRLEVEHAVRAAISDVGKIIERRRLAS